MAFWEKKGLGLVAQPIRGEFFPRNALQGLPWDADVGYGGGSAEMEPAVRLRDP